MKTHDETKKFARGIFQGK